MSRTPNENRIREIRKSTGLSQAGFAEKFHIPYPTLCSWDSGRNNPTKYVSYMIERILELEQQVEAYEGVLCNKLNDTGDTQQEDVLH